MSRTGRGRRYLERKRAELADDDTYGRTEPETVDVYADQAPADWSGEPCSDVLMDLGVKMQIRREARS